MKSDRTYDLLVEKMKEVSDMSPQTLGPFTFVYHTLIPYVKQAPWRWFAIGSFATSAVIYFFLGSAIISIVNILQHGF